MKQLLFSIVIFFATSSANAQYFELTQDRGFSNRYTDVLNVGDSLWVVSGFYQYGTVGQKSTYIKAFNQNGQEVWNFDATSSEGRVFDIILNTEQELLVMGGYQISCDIVVGEPVFFMRFNLQGELLSEHTHELNLGYFDRSELIALPSGQLVFASDVVSPDGGSYSNSMFGFNSTGEQLLWESDWEDKSIDNIVNVNESVVAFCDSQLYLVDNTGNPIDSLLYGSPPIDISVFQDASVLLLWEDSVFVLNETLDLEPAFAVDDEFENATRIFLQNESVNVWFNSLLKQYSFDFDLIDSEVFDILPNFNTADLQVSDAAICLVGNKSFGVIPVSSGSYYRSAALALYSLSESSQEFDADVAVRHLELTAFSVTQTNENPPLFNLYGEVSGYVVNTGNEEVESVKINFLGQEGICGIHSDRLYLSDINLLPGDSVFFTMAELDYTSVYVSDSIGSVDFCVFASEPSELYDRNESNDTGCVTGDFVVEINETSIGISSVYPNPTSDRIRFDFSGQPSSARLQIFDGTGKMMTNHLLSGRNSFDQNVSDWPAGIYFARIMEKGELSEAIKFSVVR